MPQNLVDTPPDWQDEIVVPAPGEPAAVANDPGKPHSLFHALAALAKRTRWLRGLLETQLNHNHDDRYAPLGHNHDDRYYPQPTVWVATSGSSPEASIQVNVPAGGPYLIEGHMLWTVSGQAYMTREFWIDGSRVFVDTRYVSGTVGGSWADQIIYNLASGQHSVQYKVITTVASGSAGASLGMVKVTRL